MGDGNDGERQLLLQSNISNYASDGTSAIGTGDPTGYYVDNFNSLSHCFPLVLMVAVDIVLF